MFITSWLLTTKNLAMKRKPKDTSLYLLKKLKMVRHHIVVHSLLWPKLTIINKNINKLFHFMNQLLGLKIIVGGQKIL